MSENQTQQQAQPVAPQRPAGRMVYGLDGVEPVPEREYRQQEMARNPMLEESISEAVERVLSGESQQGRTEEAASDAKILEQYNELAAKYQNLSRYEGIIGALESDPRMVDALQKMISGQIVEGYEPDQADDQDELERLLGEPDDEPQTSTRSRKGQMTQEQMIEAAVERGRREAMAQAELNAAINKMMQDGSTPEEAEQFVRFVADPTGITAMDLLNAYKARIAPQQATTAPKSQQPQQRELPPKPLAAASGSTDRPKAERYTDHESVGHQYVAGDPNEI